MEPIIGAFIRPAAPSHEALLLAAVSAVMALMICKRHWMMMSSPSCVMPDFTITLQVAMAAALP